MSSPRHAAAALFRDAFAESPVGMTLVDLEGGLVLDANESFRKMLGVEPAEVIGRPAADLGLWAHEGQRDDFLGELRATGRTSQRALDLRRRCGTRVPVMHSAILVDIAGRSCVLAWIVDISSLKETECELRAAEARWRSLVEQAPGVILVLDPDGTILLANRTLSGRDPREVIGRPVFGYLPAEPEQRVAERFARMLVDRRPARFEHWAAGPAGERRRLDTRLAPIVEGGAVRAVISISIDVTHGIETQEALRASEARLRSIMEHAPAVISVIDREGRLLLTNRTVTGAAPEANEGRTVFDLIPPDRVPAARRIFADVVASGRPSSFVFEMPDIAGAPRALEVNLGPTIVDGAVQSVIAIGIDVTARMAAERSLRESEQRFRDIVESMGDWYWEQDAAGRITYSSEQSLAVLGRPPAELLGRSPLEFASPEERTRQLRLLAPYLAQPRAVRDFEGWYLRPDGERVCVSVNGVPVLDAGGKLLAWRGVARDVTARVRNEAERRRLEDEIHQARRTESLGVLAGGIAHDFNNLLTAILGNTELALAELPADAALRPLLEQVQAAGVHAADLTRQMLTYAGRGRVEMRRIDLSATAREMGVLLASAVPKKVAVALELAEALPPVEADPSQLRQVVMNLVLNAADACGADGGRVTVRTGALTAPPRPPDLTLGALVPGSAAVVLEVSDTGCGVQPESLPRVFDPFFTTKFTGRGLGLAAVQGIVLRQGGEIAVWSRPGAGSTFRVVLPSAPAREEDPEDPEDPEATPWRSRGRVLVVDDEERVRHLAARMLRALGFEPVAAADGAAALEAVENADEPFRAVLLDLTMPRMDGRETCRELHGSHPGLPVILCSGYDVQEGVPPLPGLPWRACLQKPFRLADLARAMREALGE